MSDKFIVSTNEECWSDDTEFDTREEALKYGLEEYGNEDHNLFTGKKVDYIVHLGNAKDFFDRYIDWSCDEDGRGEWSEIWEQSWDKKTTMLELIDEKLREIEEIIMKHHKPDFFIVEEVQ